MEVVSRNGRHNRVSRRYHDFSKLHWMLLSASGPDMGAAKEAALRLPPKHIFSMSSLSDAFLQERQGELQRYIDRLLAAPALARCASVFSFFFGTSEDAEGNGGRSASAGGAGRDGDSFAALVAADSERSRKRGLKVPWDLRKEDKKDRGRFAEGMVGGDLEGRRSPEARVGPPSSFAFPPSPPAVRSSGSAARRRVGGRGSTSPVTRDVAGGQRGGGMLLSGGGGAGQSEGTAEVRAVSQGEGRREGEEDEDRQEGKGRSLGRWRGGKQRGGRSQSLDIGSERGSGARERGRQGRGIFMGAGRGQGRGEGRLASLLFDCLDEIMSLSQVWLWVLLFPSCPPFL